MRTIKTNEGCGQHFQVLSPDKYGISQPGEERISPSRTLSRKVRTHLGERLFHRCLCISGSSCESHHSRIMVWGWEQSQAARRRARVRDMPIGSAATRHVHTKEHTICILTDTLNATCNSQSLAHRLKWKERGVILFLRLKNSVLFCHYNRSVFCHEVFWIHEV